MLFVLAISLYTSRVILNALGVEDYGIYNVVGGVVMMLSFISNSMAGASSRFITYSLGKGNETDLKNTFSSILYVHYMLAIAIILLAETIGLWFVSTKLVIPPDRFIASMWVYQCSILSVAFGIVSVPYNSLIIAHEKMNAFAYISVLEVILKLAVAITVKYITVDKLIIYAIFVLIIQVTIMLLYIIYCKKKFIESNSRAKYHKRTVKTILSFSCWTMNGNLAVAGYTQGLNILLNLFFGTIVNAARGIAVQVQNAVMNLVSNFQVAIKPQIVKSYASNDFQYMHTLILAASKWGYYLMLIIATPILLCADSILKLWLGVVPAYTVGLVRIMLIGCLLQPLSNAIISAIHATGDIKKFQIYEGTTLLLVVPIAYILLRWFNITPEMVMLVYVAIEILAQCIRIWIVLPKIRMDYSLYFKKAIYPLVSPTICMFALLYFCRINEELSFFAVAGYVVLSIIYIIICICVLGVTKEERKSGMEYLFKLLNNVRNKS
jgi:O-antigen/teichoic acid export membrane protein